MSKEELIWIVQTVSSLPANSLIVELGVLVGRTSLPIWLSSNDHIVICIDKFGGFDVPNISGEGVSAIRDLLPEFLSNMRSAGVKLSQINSAPKAPGFYYMILDTEEAASCFDDMSVAFLFEDSDHGKVGQIIDSWKPKMMQGGIMVGHDYIKFGDWKVVSDQIDKRFSVSNPIGSIWVAEL